MPFGLDEQLKVATQSIARGDIDLLTTMLSDPRSVTPDEQRSVAESLGIKGGLLKFLVNTVSDPTVWAAFLLSRRFPTHEWLRGMIPQRFIGSANEFTGVSYITRPVETYYRGTNVPKLVALTLRRRAEVMKVGRQMFDLFENRPTWREEMPIVSLLLEGQNPSGATPELRTLAGNIRQHMDELWGFLQKTKQINGGFEGENITRAVVSDLPPNRAGAYLRDYLPHIPNIWANESVIAVSGREAIRKMGRSEVGRMMALKGMEPERVWGIGESDQLASHFSRWQEFLNNGGAQAINPRLFRRQRHGIPLMSEMGQELFITDLNVVLQRYVHGVAQTYANNAPLTHYERMLGASVIEGPGGSPQTIMPTADPIIAQIINEGIGSTGARMIRRQVPGTQYVQEVVQPGSGNIPMLRGLQTLVRAVQGVSSEDELLWGNMFSSIGRRISEGAGRMLNPKQAAYVDHAVQTFARNNDYRTLSNGIASYFYSTTLGLNPWSTLQNLLQPILTTMPTIGIGPTLAGMRTLADRIPVYSRNVGKQWAAIRSNPDLKTAGRISSAFERAFNETFPELAKHGIKVDPRLFDIDERALLSGKLQSYDAYAKLLLQPFTHAEMANQITSFYGAKTALRNALRTGEWAPGVTPLSEAHLEDMLNFEAGQVVSATQFRPGPGSRTSFQAALPSPLRMFTSFPARAASWLMESTVRGALTNKQLQEAGVLEKLFGGRNWGTIARTFLYGKIVTNGIRDTLDVDLGGALGITAPFSNIAPSGQWFAPLPVPPLPGTIFALASYATTRDIKRLQPLILPGVGEVPIPKSLVPAGIAISRVGRVMQQYRPDAGGFVDENERLMYRGNTTDAILAAMGVPLDKGRRVREIVERTSANRSAIRDYRRAFTLAASNGDTGEMQRLAASWQKAFPDMGALSVSGADLRRYQQQARIPMVQRMLRTLGSRATYLERRLYDVDPDIVAEPDPIMQLLAG